MARTVARRFSSDNGETSILQNGGGFEPVKNNLGFCEEIDTLWRF